MLIKCVEINLQYKKSKIQYIIFDTVHFPVFIYIYIAGYVNFLKICNRFRNIEQNTKEILLMIF